MAHDRMPPIPVNEMTESQKKAAGQFAAGRGTPVFGPFVPLLRSPEVMLCAKAMGDHFRFHNALPLNLSEFVILITSRQWTQQFEWTYHHPIAVKAGLKEEIVKALAEGVRPDGMSYDEALVYDFCVELQRNHSVSDATYGQARDRFGEQGIIDLVGTIGYYTFQAMVLNTARTALPEGVSPELPSFPR
jgi:4-carboxymuconolactone decarboxylase